MTLARRDFAAILSVALVAGCIQVPARAWAQNAHPAYLHALTDLRYARALLERPVLPAAAGFQERAIGEIDRALNDIKLASIDDGKDLNDHPPLDARPDDRGRLRRGIEVLRRARADIAREEDNPATQGLQRRALGHVDEAIRSIEAEIGVIERNL